MNLADVEAVLDTLATPVIVWDLSGRNLASNSAAAALFGYSAEGMRSLNRASIVHPEDLESVQARVQERLAGDRTRRHFARRIVTSRGEVRLCACSAAPFERDGEMVGTVVEYFDAARLEQVGGGFARNAAMFRELFELSPVAVFSTGPDQRFEMVNPTARLLLQRPIEDLQELSLPDVVVSAHHTFLEAAAHHDGASDNIELEVARPDGTRRWVHLSLRTLSDSRGRFAGQVGLAQDITQQVMDREAAVSAAHHDALTGALNRRAYDERVAPDV
ncbi:MAG: PAS domain S-box protein, partial [Dehalococcoidia bacterium]